MELKHGHIYFIEFNPSSGHEFKKMRPAVIISSNDLIQRSNLISCVPFTGNIGNLVEGDDILVVRNNKNKLFSDSIIKVQHISTFDKRRVKKYIGELESLSLNRLKKILIRNFNLVN
jgi:mRNA interferase MazF